MHGAWVLTIKNLCFPIFCRQCGQRLLTEENGFFCPRCWELSRRIERPFCTLCGLPHSGAAGFGSLYNFPCAKCRKARAKPYRRIYGAAYYEGAVGEAVRLLKFNDKPRLARPLGELMRTFIEKEIEVERYHDVVPVPLHRVRQRERGYNQSELLAAEIAPLFPNARLNGSLKRIRPTKIQSRIKDERERIANVRGAFAVERTADFKGRTVLLVDDVVTTGGTVAECARVLKRAGAVEVDVLAAALPVHDDPLL